MTAEREKVPVPALRRQAEKEAAREIQEAPGPGKAWQAPRRWRIH